MSRRWEKASIAFGITLLFGTADGSETFLAGTQPVARFVVLAEFQGEAVFDRTTQLTWERSPLSMKVTWATATNRCALKTVGGQSGWRLPSFIELMTLVEPQLEQDVAVPALPVGHPFLGVTPEPYWTRDTPTPLSSHAYTVDFLMADVAPRDKNHTHPLWCVRGGISQTPQPSRASQRPGLI